MAELLCNFFSYSLGSPVDIQVIIPSVSPCDMGYPEKLTHKIETKYPVLYLLHGHGNDYMCWSRFTSMQRYVEERRIVAVTCSVGNKCYMNAEYGEKYYDFIEKELPEFIKANFPVSDRTEDTYIAGLSMGGYGTLAHGLGHPQSYRAIGAFSPGIEFNDQAAKTIGHSFPPTMDLRAQLEDDLKAGKKFPDLFMCIGDKDFLYQSVAEFHKFLLEKGVGHRYDDIAGYEHEWAFWDLELPEFLDWLPRTDPYAGMIHHKM
ncbi:MAG TPA: alpha/beta hydrolase-fold protein [Mobilitalea sp.]|nr:alpha/beta hydrolase-fold protein [Mobilitalea sp.]